MKFIRLIRISFSRNLLQVCLARDGLDYIEDQFDLFFHGFDVIEALGLERLQVVGEVPMH